MTTSMKLCPPNTVTESEQTCLASKPNSRYLHNDELKTHWCRRTGVVNNVCDWAVLCSSCVMCHHHHLHRHQWSGSASYVRMMYSNLLYTRQGHCCHQQGCKDLASTCSCC
eukprot:jgi/Chrzof1/12380/Cz06g32110.t1